jgi:hypothetical protein
MAITSWGFIYIDDKVSLIAHIFPLTCKNTVFSEVFRCAKTLFKIHEYAQVGSAGGEMPAPLIPYVVRCTLP